MTKINNICLFLTGPLSNWYGSFRGQRGGFKAKGSILNSYIKKYYSEHLEKYESLYKDLEFNCGEQYMMFAKAVLFGDWDSAEKILETKKASEQQSLGRAVKHYSQIVWERARVPVMVDGLYLKFTQNPELKTLLVETCKNYILCECNPQDSIWGNGLGEDDIESRDVNTWKGQNLLGQVLMQVRYKILFEPPP